jgi:hypothetical protein
VKHPVTPDRRDFVVRGRLWRMANSDLEEAERADLVGRLMAAGGRYASGWTAWGMEGTLLDSVDLHAIHGRKLCLSSATRGASNRFEAR